MGWCATLAIWERGTQCLSDFNQFPRWDKRNLSKEEKEKWTRKEESKRSEYNKSVLRASVPMSFDMNTSQIASLIECLAPCLRNMNVKWVIDRMIRIVHTYPKSSKKLPISNDDRGNKCKILSAKIIPNQVWKQIQRGVRKPQAYRHSNATAYTLWGAYIWVLSLYPFIH